MYKQILFQWAFYRILGLKDLGKFIEALKNKKQKIGDFNVTVVDDIQIDSGVEPMDAGSKTCPTWYSTRIFKGREQSPTDKPDQEYWYGCRETFLAPIIPIPICAEEIVVKLGDNEDAYNACFSKYGRMHSMLDHKEEYCHRVVDEAYVEFKNCDILYKNDTLYSVYYGEV